MKIQFILVALMAILGPVAGLVINFLSEKRKYDLLYPFAYILYTCKSFLLYFKVISLKEKVYIEKYYNGEKILLLALYEKGVLRNDIIFLLKNAKKNGLYVVCVNTSNLDRPYEKYGNLIDFYIERYNYGRDFGSYKLGFIYLYRNKWINNCPRLIMMNDSVFYSKKRLDPFMDKLVNTRTEVLGATENHDREHHLGSFCISLDNCILTHRKFKFFWHSYSMTNIRSKIIRKGERKLSKILRQCASSFYDFRALYNLAWISSYIDNNPDFMTILPEMFRKSDKIIQWDTPSLKKSTKIYFKENFILDSEIKKYKKKDDYRKEYLPEVFSKENNSHSIHCIDDIILLISQITNNDKVEFKKKIYAAVRDHFITCAGFGSQIHQNCIVFLYLGLPLVKLDGLYRGAFSIADFYKISALLEQDERDEFRKMLFARPYGGDHLVFLQRAAFERGLI